MEGSAKLAVLCRSVTALAKHQYTIGEQITMKLMKKTKGSTSIVPCLAWEKNIDEGLRNVAGKNGQITIIYCP